jgi:hypothetical protein
MILKASCIYLGIQWKGIEPHRADEGYMGGLLFID